MRPALVEAPPDDARAVGREEWAAVVAGHRRQPLGAGLSLVCPHDVDLAEVGGIHVELLPFGGRELAVVRLARGREHNPLAVGGVAGLGVVALRVRQSAQLARLRGAHVQLHLRVVVPRIAPFLAAGAELQLLVLQLLRVRIVMGGREQDVVGRRVDERARGLASAGRDPGRAAAGQVEAVNLIEGIARLALALEHQRLAVGGPVAFARAPSLHGEAPDPGEEVSLGRGWSRALPAQRGRTHEACHERGQNHDMLTGHSTSRLLTNPESAASAARG